MKSEAAVQSEIRAEAGRRGILLWRNNVGACVDERGQMIRYGLGNDSVQVSKRIKSSDLIGILNQWCGQDAMPGVDPPMILRGIFLAVEAKREGWKFSHADERAVAQCRFMHLVRNAGGLAGFATCLEDFDDILNGGNVLPQVDE